MYSQWSLAKVSATSTPSAPPSPPVVAAPGTLPTVVFDPLGEIWMTLKVSRSIVIALPLGRKARPHGMSLLVVTWVTLPTWSGLPPPPPPLVVVAVIVLLAGERLPAASLA